MSFVIEDIELSWNSAEGSHWLTTWLGNYARLSREQGSQKGHVPRKPRASERRSLLPSASSISSRRWQVPEITIQAQLLCGQGELCSTGLWAPLRGAGMGAAWTCRWNCIQEITWYVLSCLTSVTHFLLCLWFWVLDLKGILTPVCNTQWSQLFQLGPAHALFIWKNR